MSSEPLILSTAVGALLSAAGYLQNRKMEFNTRQQLEPYNVPVESTVFDWLKFGKTVFFGAAVGLAGSYVVTEPEGAAALAGILTLLKLYVFKFSFTAELDKVINRLKPKTV